MDYAGADIQGAVGYMFVKALRNEFRRRGIARQPVARGNADPGRSQADPAFANPTKPIGSHMDEEARQGARRRFRLDRARGRRTRLAAGGAFAAPASASSRPASIRDLARQGYVVVACGGGGIPVIENEQGDLAASRR